MSTGMPLVHQTDLVTRGLLTNVVNREVEETLEVAEKRSDANYVLFSGLF